jgi:hypothetical protein
MLTFFDTWLPYIYLYGVGGIFFFFGLVIIRKSGAIDLNNKKHRHWYRVIIFGFFYFAAMHALLNIAALYW